MAQTFNPSIQNAYAVATGNYAIMNVKNSPQAVAAKREVIDTLDTVETDRGTNYTGDTMSYMGDTVSYTGMYNNGVSEALYGGSCYDCGSSGYDIPLLTAREGENKYVNYAILGLAIIGLIIVLRYFMGKKA